MKTTLRKFGNSQGVIIPKALLAQFGLESEIEMTVTQAGIVLSKPNKHPREGWAHASQQLAHRGDDALVWPEFGNEEDSNLVWPQDGNDKISEWLCFLAPQNWHIGEFIVL